MVLLDVVYNHFGTTGNAIEAFAPAFFKQGGTPWGPAPDFNRAEVRSFFLQNALYWLETYRFDGLRIDAADHLAGGDEDVDFLIEMAGHVKRAITSRHVHIVTEDARNAASPMRPSSDGLVGVDAEWNDDFHHVIHVATTHEDGGIYEDFANQPYDGLRRSLATGFVYQGHPRPSHNFAGSGEPSSHLPPHRFVNFLHNHDQAGNRLRGERLHSLIQPPLFDTLETILLLAPQTPLMFMGDDHGSTNPFFFFSDHPENDREQEIKNRLKQAESFQGELPPEAPEVVLDPNDLHTMQISTLKWDEAETTEGKLARERMKALFEKRRRYIWPLLCSDFEREFPLTARPSVWRSTGISARDGWKCAATFRQTSPVFRLCRGKPFSGTAISRARAMAIMPCNLRSVPADRSKETKRPRQCLVRPVQLAERRFPAIRRKGALERMRFDGRGVRTVRNYTLVKIAP